MTIREGDWVRATQNLTYGLVGGSTIKSGTRGVVTRVINGWFSSTAHVRFDGGFGTVTGTVPTRHLRVVRRGGGVDRFMSHQSRVTVARAALMLFLAWPVISFVAQYVWAYRSLEGITETFANGILDSIGEWITMLLTNPIRTIIYLAFLGILGRLAWR